MQVVLTKTLNGLIPADQSTAEWFGKLKVGEAVHGDFKKYRNIGHHRKLFALLNFDRFRSDLTILAGYYHTTVRLDGSVRVEPKSIAFASMGQDEFEVYYSKIIDVLIKYVYGSHMTREQMDELVQKYLDFA